MRLAMLPNRDPKRESRCLLLPRVALGNLGPPSCDSLHRPGLRVLPSAHEGEQFEAGST